MRGTKTGIFNPGKSKDMSPEKNEAEMQTVYTLGMEDRTWKN